MGKGIGFWVRRMVAFALALVAATGGLIVQSRAYALDDNEDVVPMAEQSAVALEQEEEIALLQQANPEAVAYVTSSGSQTTYADFNEALTAWSSKVGNVTLTLLQNAEATVSAPVRFASSGKKTLNLNGHTATLTMADRQTTGALIYVGKYSDQGASDVKSVELVIDDYSRAAQNDPANAGALICDNALNVINVTSYRKADNVNNNECPSSLELHRGTISGGTQNTILVDSADGTYDATFLMTGGTISGCASAVVGGGAPAYTGYGVRLCGKALFEMWGGTICENAGGGGVWLYEPVFQSYASLRFIMYGGAICDNGAEGVRIANGSSLQYGDIIFTMTGGEITGNGTGVLVSNYVGGVFNLKGSPRILDNGSNGVARNVVLESDKKVTITGALATPEGANGPQIGITLNKNGAAVPFTNDYDDYNPNTDPATFFKSDVATARDSSGKGGNAYVCWTSSENDDGTAPLSTEDEGAEAARMLHVHDWKPCYQYAFDLGSDGEPVASNQENLLTAVCEAAYTHPYTIKHGACDHALSATLTLNAQGKEYDGTPATATLTPSEGWVAENIYQYDESKITYFKKNGDALTPLSGAPKEVGDYVAQYKLDGDTSWTPSGYDAYGFITASFSITPRVDPPAPPTPPAPSAPTTPTEPTTPPATNNGVAYAAHCQSYGWKAPAGLNGTTAGTIGKSKRLEAFTIKLADTSAGSIQYRSHVQGIGWEKTWKANGKVSGTIGKSRRVEAIQIRLTGAAKDAYDVYYRVHSQRYGWMAWAKNGALAGTQGMSRRIEAFQVVLVKKGAPAPATTYKGATQQYAKAFVKK